MGVKFKLRHGTATFTSSNTGLLRLVEATSATGIARRKRPIQMKFHRSFCFLEIMDLVK